MSEPTPSIPKGSWILVTGATGFLASHIVKQFAERGYRVRGTVRDLAKAQWLVNDPTFLKPYADIGSLELVQVPDLFSPDTDLAGVVKGMSAIVHVATDTSFSPDPNKVIPQTVAGVTALMEAAAREPSVKEFVYTSSFLAAAVPMPALPGTPVTAVKRDTWNDAFVQMAWAQAENPSPRAGAFVYTASKVEAEKAVWKFVAEKKPGFAVNTICPSQLLGEPLCKAHVNSGAAWIRQLYDGETAMLMGFPAVISVNVKDIAALHVAAVLDPQVQSERLQAWAQHCNWNDVLAIMRKLYPRKEFVDDLPNLAPGLALETDLSQARALLKKWAGQDDWKSLEETITDNTKVLDNREALRG